MTTNLPERDSINEFDDKKNLFRPKKIIIHLQYIIGIRFGYWIEVLPKNYYHILGVILVIFIRITV